MIILAASGVCAAELPADFGYHYKTGDVMRFEYSKSVRVKQVAEKQKPEERLTEVSAILILEIKSVAKTGAAAVLRFDSPRLTLPDFILYSPQADEAQILAEKNRAAARAMEGAIKSARWNVILSGDGTLRLDGRTPSSMRDWLKEPESAAGWRKKSLDALESLVEQNMGLKAQGDDHEIFLSLSAAGREKAERSGEPSLADQLRARRTGVALVSNDGEKAEFKFTRRGPDDKSEAYEVPGLDRVMRQKVEVRFKSVKSKEGKAVFDVNTGMLDTLNEEYSQKLEYTLGLEKLTQELNVQYKLRRLAPPITKIEPGTVTN